jgi:dihydrofolate synthase/folylpolyglutamate synthase
VTYKEALAWLYSLQRFGIKLGLENIRRLLAELGTNRGNATVIHVAGTNGKGSVCAMIDAVCRVAGYRTGLFTSPHLVTFRERIRVDGEMISEDDVANRLTDIRSLVRDWDPHPTFFEITTALALKHFLAAKSELIVLETGLGGRLDATNAVQSNVSVITPVALDHQNWLGDSIDKIAAEKAGIIKARTPVVSAPQLPAAEKVIRDRAAECDATLQFVYEPYIASPIALRGEHQKLNASISVAAIRAAKIDVDESAIRRGLANVEWPARFQCWDNRTVIDGAHNPAAATTLVESWRQMFGDERATVILAVLSDKDLRGICEALIPIADSFLLPRIKTERAAEPAELAKVIAGVSPGNRSGCPAISASIREALDLARAESNPILITGSLHFAGEILAFLRGQPAAFEECAQ